jgi:DNA-binding response OmpR family regulator
MPSSPPRVLIVVDDSALASELAADLDRQGFCVDVVDSGLAAIRQVWEERYARVLVDGGLRGMRAQKLKRNLMDLSPDSEVLVIERQSRAA